MALIDQLPFPRIDLTARDFNLIKTALINFIMNERPDAVDDFLDSQLGVLMIEFVAYTGDVLSFEIDDTANEGYLPTAQRRENAVNLTKITGFEPFKASAASVVLTINNQQAFALPATIPAGTQIDLGGGLFFEILEDYVLPAGTAFVLEGPTAVEGRSFSEGFVGTGLAGQTYQLSNFPTIANSVVVRVDAVLQAEVDALVFAQDEPVYVLRFNKDDRATFNFGNNINGLAPEDGSDIQAEYRVGGGEQGNIAVAVIRTNIDAILSDNTPVKIFVENRVRGSGGSNRQTLESIKLNAPAQFRTRDNANTRRDFNTLARGFSDPTFGTIAKAMTIRRLGQTNSSANEIDIFVWTRTVDGALSGASLGLRDALKEYLDDEPDGGRRILNIDIFVQNGGILTVNLEVDAVSVPSFSDPDSLRVAIEDAIKTYFARPDIEPGDTLRVSQLYAAILGVPSVVSAIIKDADTGLDLSDIAVDDNVAWSLGTLVVNVEVPKGSTGTTVPVP